MTTRLFWWQDDFALLFKLQHISEGAGYFGAGIWGGGPYRGLVAPIYPFFHWFGLAPAGYFLVAIGIRALAAAATYLFSRYLFGSRPLGLAAGAIVATTLTSTDTMLRIQNSFQSFLGIIAVLLTLGTVVASLRTRGWKRAVWYFLSIGLFWATLEGFFVRSHGLALGIVAFTVVLGASRAWKSWGEVVLRLVPIGMLFRLYYLGGDGETSGRLGDFVTFARQNTPDVILNPLITFGNVLLPRSMTEGLVTAFGGGWVASGVATAGLAALPLFLLWLAKVPRTTKIVLTVVAAGGILALFALARVSGHAQDFITIIPAAAFGIATLVSFGALSVSLWKAEHYVGKVLLVALLWMGASFVIYYAQYPATAFANRHRYLIYALPALGWLVAATAWAIPHLLDLKERLRTRVFTVLVALVAVGGIAGNNRYVQAIVQERGIPTKTFYAELTRLVPTLPKDALLYLVSAPDPLSQGHIKNFFSVGSMPNSTAIAIWYGLDRYDFKLIENIDEFLSAAAQEAVPLGEVFVLTYSAQEGLQDHSAEVRTILQEGQTVPLATSAQRTTAIVGGQGVQPLFEYSGLNLSGILPAFIQGTASIEPLSLAALPDPYADVSDLLQSIDAQELARTASAPARVEDAEATFAWLRALEEFKRSGTVTTDSQWKFQESRNLSDPDRATTWLAHRIHWADTRSETITLTLPQPAVVEGLYWMNGHYTRTPTRYRIETSEDGRNWSEALTVTEVRKLPTLAARVDRFAPRQARAMRMVITDTFEHDSPSLGDIAPVPQGLGRVEPEVAFTLGDRPFASPLGRTEAPLAFAYVQESGAGLLALYNVDRLGWRTEHVVRSSVAVGGSHPFEALYPGGFTLLEGLRLGGFSLPATVTLGNLTLHYPSLQEMKDKNLIKTFSEN